MSRYPLGHNSGVYTQMFSNLAEGKGPYQAKMMFCVFQNPMMSVPGSGTVAAALAKLDKLVVIDTMLSETAMLADYVLPGTVYLERYDLNSHWVTWPVLGLRQPVVKPSTSQADAPKAADHNGQQQISRPSRGMRAGLTILVVS